MFSCLLFGASLLLSIVVRVRYVEEEDDDVEEEEEDEDDGGGG